MHVSLKSMKIIKTSVLKLELIFVHIFQKQKTGIIEMHKNEVGLLVQVLKFCSPASVKGFKHNMHASPGRANAIVMKNDLWLLSYVMSTL